MVYNEPLRPEQRLEPDCPGFFIALIANSANAETASCFAFPAALRRPQSAFGAVLDQSILLKREGPLLASYGLLWRSVDDRVHGVPRRGQELCKQNSKNNSFQQLSKQASCKLAGRYFYARIYMRASCITVLNAHPTASVGKNNPRKALVTQD